MRIPKYIYIETTNKCNAECIMCPHKKMKRKQGIMSLSLFKKIIDYCSHVDLSQTTIFLHKEGEPLLDPYIFERSKYIKKMCSIANLAINTNGSLLSKENVNKLLCSGLDKLFISIDGVSSMAYNFIRKGLDYEILKNNIQYLFRKKKDENSKMEIVLQMTVCKFNKHEIEFFTDTWKDSGAELYIKSMHSYLDGEFSSMTEIKTEKQQGVCRDPFNVIVVFWDGSYGVCCWDYDNLYKIGNFKNESVIEAFNNKQFSEMRKKQLEQNCYNIEPCSRCMRIFGNDKVCDYSGIESM